MPSPLTTSQPRQTSPKLSANTPHCRSNLPPSNWSCGEMQHSALNGAYSQSHPATAMTPAEGIPYTSQDFPGRNENNNNLPTMTSSSTNFFRAPQMPPISSFPPPTTSHFAPIRTTFPPFSPQRAVVTPNLLQSFPPVSSQLLMANQSQYAQASPAQAAHVDPASIDLMDESMDW